MDDDLTMENTDIQIVMDYVRILTDKNDVPSYKYFAAVATETIKIFRKPHPDADAFKKVLDTQIPRTATGISSLALRTVVEALQHPDCPEEYLVAALNDPITEYREAAFNNPSTPEDAKIAYWLTKTSTA